MRAAILLMMMLLATLPAWSETVSIEAGRDATLIEDPEGSLANGAGPVVFVGLTSQPQNGIRRALVWFDVAAALPRGVIIESVALRLSMTPSHSDPQSIRLYRVLANWGEGPSATSGGGGTLASLGDVTWLYTFWDTELWIRGGGQFVPRPSAEQVVAVPGDYVWSDNLSLINDVRLWASAPQRNFGWIVIGDEATPQTVKSFASRENIDPSLRPLLEITYRPTRPAEGP